MHIHIHWNTSFCSHSHLNHDAGDAISVNNLSAGKTGPERWGSWMAITLQWRHNGYDGVSNHQPHDCLLNRLFRRRSQKTSELRVTGLCVGIHRWPVNSPHKRPVTWKMFPFDDVIMNTVRLEQNGCHLAHNIFKWIFFNSMLSGIFEWNFQGNFSDLWIKYLLWNCSEINATELHQWKVKIGWGNGLVPSGNKPLSELMLT